MWRRFFDTLLPDAENLLPRPVQQAAEARIRQYWIAHGWQLVLGEGIISLAAVGNQMASFGVYILLTVMMATMYALGWLWGRTTLWLHATVFLLLTHGMLVRNLGAVTALTFIVPYTIGGMLLNGQKRKIVQMACLLAFWGSLVYGVLPVLAQLNPPNYIVISYDILLAVFTFQFSRFLSQLAVEINSVYVTNEVRGQSQQFLARVSHELRTPLNSILGFAKLLNRPQTTLDERQRAYLAQVVEEGEHLNRLVSDLLDSARLATGKISLQIDDCNVNALCTAIAEEHRPLVSGVVRLNTQLAADLPVIQADPVRLRQAIANLVANAVKYTERGEIAISTRMEGKLVAIAIRDTGIGISEEQKELVFVPFVQLNQRQIGVGLGLDIALQLVRLHGGDISLTSQPGQGSTFTIRLPRLTKPTLASDHEIGEHNSVIWERNEK